LLKSSRVKADREQDKVPQILRVDEEVVVSSDGDDSDTEILYSAIGPEPQDNLDNIDLDSAGYSDRSSLGVSTDRSSDFDTAKLEEEFLAEMDRCSRLMHTEEIDRDRSANKHSRRVVDQDARSGISGTRSAVRERNREAESHNGRSTNACGTKY
jgi:hypothetical protein